MKKWLLALPAVIGVITPTLTISSCKAKSDKYYVDGIEYYYTNYSDVYIGMEKPIEKATISRQTSEPYINDKELKFSMSHGFVKIEITATDKTKYLFGVYMFIFEEKSNIIILPIQKK